MRDEHTRWMIRRGVLRSYAEGRTLSAAARARISAAHKIRRECPGCGRWLNDVWMRRHVCSTYEHPEHEQDNDHRA